MPGYQCDALCKRLAGCGDKTRVKNKTEEKKLTQRKGYRRKRLVQWRLTGANE